MQENEQDMRALLEESIKALDFNPGDVVKGKVEKVSQEGVLVNVGYKQEIFISNRELAFPEPEDAHDIANVGDEIEVYIVAIGGEDSMKLSKRRADEMVAWEKVKQQYDEKATINVKVTKVIKGGLLASVMGLRGFIPASQIEPYFIHNLNGYVGQSLDVRIIEYNDKKQRLILSHKVLREEELAKQQEEVLATLEEGEERVGHVKRLVEYGAFVDLGGIDGLVHISDIAWEHVKHPSDVLKVGQEVKVLVKSFDPETKRISLSIKDTLPDPWYDKIEKYSVGEYVTGKIVKLTDFGAFMQLEKGLDGLIRMRELSEKPITRADEAVKTGDVVKAKLIHIDKTGKKIALSLTRVKQDAQQADYDEYKNSAKESE